MSSTQASKTSGIPTTITGQVLRNNSTTVPGLYAAGDVSDYELKQVVTACARGAFASYHAAHYLETRGRGA